MAGTNPKTPTSSPRILQRAEHGISRKEIDESTLKVLYRLHRNGFKAYLVGGSVRDLLLGRTPKDFDVGTDATPQEVRKLFRNGFLVGRRFRLAHIRFGRNQVVEVATFRRHPKPDELPDDPAEHAFFVQNQFGTPREDAFRRDFTINALFYDIANFTVIDHVGGLEDLEKRRLHVIGDPLVRFSEDPVRMLRALEFGARLDFTLSNDILDAIEAKASLIAEAAPARIREEIGALFNLGVGASVLRRADEFGLLTPMTGGYTPGKNTFKLLQKLNDHFAATGRVDEAMLLTALHIDHFWGKCPVKASLPISEVLQAAGHLLAPYCVHFRLSHGLRHQARELLAGCYRFARGLGHRGQKRFLNHPETPRSLEIFRLWTEACDGDKKLLATWEKALHTDHAATAKPGRKTNRRTRKRRTRHHQPKPA